MVNKTNNRRIPAQKRSRERVKNILKVSGEILEREGYDALTMQRIAEKAEISISSIYQFYANVENIITELVQLWSSGFNNILDSTESFAVLPLRDSIDQVIDAYVNFFRKTPGFRVIYFRRRLEGQARRIDKTSNHTLAMKLIKLWKANSRLLVLDDDTLLETAEIVIRTSDTLMALAFRLDPEGKASIIEDAKAMLYNYLKQKLGDDESPVSR